MGLRRTGKNWDDLAGIDTYWAILGYPDLRSGKWEEREFFRTGEREIEKLMIKAAELSHPHGRDRALDFGCGIGRLTRPMAQNFAEACGVDVSASMISQARALNADLANCHFVQNRKAHLRLFEDDTFDLVYTMLVLQHQPSRRVAVSLIREFVRVLKPGGLLMFHVLTYLPWRRMLQPRRRVYALMKLLGYDPRVLFERYRLAPVQLTAVPEAVIASVLNSKNARVLRVEPGEIYLAAGAESRNYWVTK